MSRQEPTKIHPALSETKLAEAQRALQANPSDPKNGRVVAFWERNLHAATLGAQQSN